VARFQRLKVPDGGCQHEGFVRKRSGPGARQNPIRTRFRFPVH
jgi:hypothetical protein